MHPQVLKDEPATTSLAGVDPIVRLQDFLRITRLGRSTIYRLINEGVIERPLQISTRTVGWRASVVKAFLDSRPVSGGQQ
jgi:prophage regulatory protein